MRNAHHFARATRGFKFSHGFSLIELLIAVTLGLVLVAGAAKVYVGGRRSHDLNESVARMQESARYALSVLEPDIRLSNNWGLTKDAEAINPKIDQTMAVNALGGNSNNCGRNFALDLTHRIEGSNNSFALGVGRNSSCIISGSPLATADTLTIRRAATNSTPTGTLRICSNRQGGDLILDTTTCAGPPLYQSSDLLVHAYYIATDSSSGTDIPSLHRMTLVTGRDFRDIEIVSGIEDMQVQFGIDESKNPTGIATHYIDVGVAGAFTGQVVSVRIWLLVRAETPEADFVDDTQYVYGDRASGTSAYDLNDPANAAKAYVPASSPGTALNDVKHYRRMLVSRTIQVRNAIGT